jgi:hypothetical protein
MSIYRRDAAYQLRLHAAEMARDRVHPAHQANGDEQKYASVNYAMCFTKGLRHSNVHGLIQNREDFEQLRRAIDEGSIDAFTAHVRVSPEKARAWEAPTAGLAYDLEGPDAQAVTMPPAPGLGSDELAYEMAEVYELALVRDQPFAEFITGSGNIPLNASIGRLNSLPYATMGHRSRPRKTEAGVLTEQTVFRGSSPKVEVGPYLSQFLLIGNDTPGVPSSAVADGFIQYGPQRIDQRVPAARLQDYLTMPADWLAAQNGENLRNNTILFDPVAPRRFIATPRDLATYVHDDALYQAYLNACLILLSMGAPFDPGFAHLSGQPGRGRYFNNSLSFDGTFLDPLESHEREAGGFALYGGPHILTLVTEVATRALKAVRFQKFNTHIRLRPEALAGRIHYAGAIQANFPSSGTAFTDLESSIAATVAEIRMVNTSGSALLPMAFQEGSPMHPSYGAGHATVAGACVTILKAYFDTSAVFVNRTGSRRFALYESGDQAIQYRPNSDGSALIEEFPSHMLTLEGELNKLAANISIGRNMAGVHYFSDYYDSLRMGERIAIEILQEQALCYPTDPFIVSVPTFDGEVVRIGSR